jgi:hypothetical protein
MNSQKTNQVVHSLLDSMSADNNAVDKRNASAYCITTQMMNQVSKINPDETANNGLNPIVQLQKMGITGARLVTLHSAICSGNLIKLFAVSKAVELNIVTSDKVNGAIDGSDTLDVDKLLFRVRQVATRFGVQQ